MFVRRGVTGSLLVLIGGLLVATLPRSTPLVQIELVYDLRNHMAGRMLGLTLVMAGLGLIGASWLHLCRHVTHTDRPLEERLWMVRRAAFAWSLPLLVAPPLFSRDGWSYAAQGALVHAGWSPYEYGPAALSGPIIYGVDPRWQHTATPYGPLPLIFGDAFAGVTLQPWLLVIAHRMLALAGLTLLVWAVPRLARWGGANPALATALVCASPLMVANGVAGLHNDLLMAGLMAAALVVAIDHGWVWGSALAGLATAIKAPAGIVCLAIALASLPVAAPYARRVGRAVASGAVAMGVVLGLGLMWGLGSGWIAALTVPGTVATPLSVTTLLGQAGDWLAGSAALEHPVRDLTRQIGSVIVLAVAAVMMLRAETGSPRAAVRAAAVTVGVLVLLSPVVHLWYFLWVLPFVAALPLRRPHLTGLVAVCLIAGLVAPLDSSLHGAYAAIVTGIMWAVTATLILLLTRAARERLQRITSGSHEPVAVEAG